MVNWLLELDDSLTEFDSMIMKLQISDIYVYMHFVSLRNDDQLNMEYLQHDMNSRGGRLH